MLRGGKGKWRKEKGEIEKWERGKGTAEMGKGKGGEGGGEISGARGRVRRLLLPPEFMHANRLLLHTWAALSLSFRPRPPPRPQTSPYSRVEARE